MSSHRTKYSVNGCADLVASAARVLVVAAAAVSVESKPVLIACR